MDDAIIQAADHAARHWRYDSGGQRDDLSSFCRMLLETFNPYKPAVIDWPKLDDRGASAADQPADLGHRGADRRQRPPAHPHLCATASPTRCCARRSSSRPSRKAATRRCCRHLVAAYGIQLAPEPDYVEPRDAEWAFMVTGYSANASTASSPSACSSWRERSGFFPPELVDTFEPVIQEEGRHILFFVNWVAWHRRQHAAVAAAVVLPEDAGGVGFLIWERIGIAREVGGGPKQDANFTVTGAAVGGRRYRYGRADGFLPGGERPADGRI